MTGVLKHIYNKSLKRIGLAIVTKFFEVLAITELKVAVLQGLVIDTNIVVRTSGAILQLKFGAPKYLGDRARVYHTIPQFL